MKATKLIRAPALLKTTTRLLAFLTFLTCASGQETIQVRWGFDVSPLINATVGDTLNFTWDQNGFHDVFIHPSRSCRNTTGAIPIYGQPSLGGNAMYTLQPEDGTPNGKNLFFACHVGDGIHCLYGVNQTVKVFSAPGTASPVTVSPTQTPIAPPTLAPSLPPVTATLTQTPIAPPTSSPSIPATDAPTSVPATETPSQSPSESVGIVSSAPTSTPAESLSTTAPTAAATLAPTEIPSQDATNATSLDPDTSEPSDPDTSEPSVAPTLESTFGPEPSPSPLPLPSPSAIASESSIPATLSPTGSPVLTSSTIPPTTEAPTNVPTPIASESQGNVATDAPESSAEPTFSAALSPSVVPSQIAAPVSTGTPTTSVPTTTLRSATVNDMEMTLFGVDTFSEEEVAIWETETALYLTDYYVDGTNGVVDYNVQLEVQETQRRRMLQEDVEESITLVYIQTMSYRLTNPELTVRDIVLDPFATDDRVEDYVSIYLNNGTVLPFNVTTVSSVSSSSLDTDAPTVAPTVAPTASPSESPEAPAGTTGSVNRAVVKDDDGLSVGAIVGIVVAGIALCFCCFYFLVSEYRKRGDDVDVEINKYGEAEGNPYVPPSSGVSLGDSFFAGGGRFAGEAPVDYVDYEA